MPRSPTKLLEMPMYNFNSMNTIHKTFQNERKQMKKRRVKAEETRSKKMIRVRMFPIWLRLVIVMSLIIVSLVVGAMVGYSVIGDGKALDVFKKSTWTHIGDMVNGK